MRAPAVVAPTGHEPFCTTKLFVLPTLGIGYRILRSLGMRRCAMARTLSDRLSEAAQGAFVGREDELRALTDAVQAADPPFAVAYIHGPGGIGKSSFVRATLDALPKEYQRLRLDCREVEPTADGVLSALAALIGGENKPVDVETLSQRLAHQARRCVIVFDTYELFGLLDTWLRQTLLPALPASVVTL